MISALAIEANEEWMHWRYLVDMEAQETDSEEESGLPLALRERVTRFRLRLKLVTRFGDLEMRNYRRFRT